MHIPKIWKLSIHSLPNKFEIKEKITTICRHKRTKQSLWILLGSFRLVLDHCLNYRKAHLPRSFATKEVRWIWKSKTPISFSDIRWRGLVNFVRSFIECSGKLISWYLLSRNNETRNKGGHTAKQPLRDRIKETSSKEPSLPGWIWKLFKSRLWILGQLGSGCITSVQSQPSSK